MLWSAPGYETLTVCINNATICTHLAFLQIHFEDETTTSDTKVCPKPTTTHLAKSCTQNLFSSSRPYFSTQDWDYFCSTRCSVYLNDCYSESKLVKAYDENATSFLRLFQLLACGAWEATSLPCLCHLPSFNDSTKSVRRYMLSRQGSEILCINIT